MSETGIWDCFLYVFRYLGVLKNYHGQEEVYTLAMASSRLAPE